LGLRRLGRDFDCCCGVEIEGVVTDGGCLLGREGEVAGDGGDDDVAAAAVFVFGSVDVVRMDGGVLDCMDFLGWMETALDDVVGPSSASSDEITKR
jgi:hypothetical protein